MLNLANNSLREIPPGLGYMKALTTLNVDGNLLRSMRRAVYTQGTEKLKKYLRSRASDGDIISPDITTGAKGAFENDAVQDAEADVGGVSGGREQWKA